MYGNETRRAHCLFWSNCKRACGMQVVHFLICEITGPPRLEGYRSKLMSEGIIHMCMESLNQHSPFWTMSKNSDSRPYKLKAIVVFCWLLLQLEKSEALPLLGSRTTSASRILPVINHYDWMHSTIKAQSSSLHHHL